MALVNRTRREKRRRRLFLKNFSLQIIYRKSES